jgi:hypothetical protein
MTPVSKFGFHCAFEIIPNINVPLAGLYKHFSTAGIPGRWFSRLITLPETVLECHPIMIAGYVSIPWEHFKEWCNEYPKNDLRIEVSPRISFHKDTSPKPNKLQKRSSINGAAPILPPIYVDG